MEEFPRIQGSVDNNSAADSVQEIVLLTGIPRALSSHAPGSVGWLQRLGHKFVQLRPQGHPRCDLTTYVIMTWLKENASLIRGRRQFLCVPNVNILERRSKKLLVC